MVTRSRISQLSKADREPLKESGAKMNFMILLLFSDKAKPD